ENCRPELAYLGLDGGGARAGAAAVGQQPPLLVGQVAAVDIGGVRAEQAQVADLLDHAEAAGRGHGPGDGGGDGDFAGQGPLGLDHVVVAVGRPPSGQGHGQQAVVGGEVGAADPPDVVGG